MRDEDNEAPDSDEEERSNQVFNVKDAVPPTDYDAPYSVMPSNVVLKRVKGNVKNSYMNMAKQKLLEIKEANKKKEEKMAKASKNK